MEGSLKRGIFYTAIRTVMDGFAKISKAANWYGMKRRLLEKGAIAYADGRFYCLGEGDGRVILIEATPKGWTPKGEFTISPQTKQRNPKGKVWTHRSFQMGKCT